MKGWKYDATRHSLAARGVKTGRKESPYFGLAVAIKRAGDSGMDALGNPEKQGENVPALSRKAGEDAFPKVGKNSKSGYYAMKATEKEEVVATRIFGKDFDSLNASEKQSVQERVGKGYLSKKMEHGKKCDCKHCYLARHHWKGCECMYCAKRKYGANKGALQDAVDFYALPPDEFERRGGLSGE